MREDGEITVEALAQRMAQAFEQQAGYPAGSATDVGIRIRTLAGELYALYTRLEFFRRQSFPATATGTYLEEHARMRGLERKQAGTASGTVTFYRNRSEDYALVDYDPLADPLLADAVEIPQGTICATAGSMPMQFITTDTCLMEPGIWQVDAPVQAAGSGRAYNAAPGVVNTLVNAPQGVTGVTNQGYIYGGGDAEPDEALRSRIEQSYAIRDNGVNAQYYISKAVAFAQVISANVLPRVRGDGTVDVAVRTHTNEGEELIEQITRELEQNRELCCDVLVRYAQPYEQAFVLDVTSYYGSDREIVRQACEEAAYGYIDALAVGEPVRLSVLIGRVMAVDGVVNCQVSEPGGDVHPPLDCYTVPAIQIVVSVE